MKNLFNRSIKFLVGLSVVLVASSVGLSAHAENQCSNDFPDYAVRYNYFPPDVDGKERAFMYSVDYIDFFEYANGSEDLKSRLLACRYYCVTGYHYDDKEKCVQNSCRGTVPEGAMANNPNNPPETNGQTYWYYDPNASNPCTFRCMDRYYYDESQKKCIQYSCEGTIPTNGEQNNSLKPTSSGIHYTYAPGSGAACTFHCQDGYHYNSVNKQCEDNVCSGNPPENAIRNNDYLPNNHNTTSWTFDEEGSETACTYHCKKNYEYKNNSCKRIEVECFFCNLKSNVINNILSGGVWDMIMDKLDTVFQFDGDNVTVQYNPVPKGAIMAFDIGQTGGKCPKGWTRYAKADGRFLMGSNKTYQEQGGSPSVTLELKHIPHHQHYIFGPYVADGIDLSSNGGDNSINESNRDRDARDVYVAYYSDHNSDEEYQMRSYGSTTEPMKGLTSGPKGGVVNGSSPTAFNIINPFVTVIYCIKN